jgi:hypothetical protein
MGRSCTICSHESRDAIEDAFIAGTPKRRIASHYGVSERAVRYHTREHLPALLALARDAGKVSRADGLLDRIEALQSRTLTILEATQETGEHRTALAAIREARGNLELIGEITREVNRTPTLNLSVHPEYIEARTLIVRALDPYPQAKEAVARALKNGGNGAD